MYLGEPKTEVYSMFLTERYIPADLCVFSQLCCEMGKTSNIIISKQACNDTVKNDQK